ncbi:hypothetical protein QMP26_41675 (plasmid) [Enterocloster clostridioformis]
MKEHAEKQKRYKYYLPRMPVDTYTIPDCPENPIIEVINYGCDARIPVRHEDFCAWGEVIYAQALTDEQLQRYDIKPSRFNPDIKEKIYEQTQVVGEWESRYHIKDTERITWWYPDFGSFVLNDTCSIELLAEHYEKILLYNQMASEEPASCPDPKTIFKKRLLSDGD